MRFSPRAGDATIFKKIASPSQAKNRSCSRGLRLSMRLRHIMRQDNYAEFKSDTLFVSEKIMRRDQHVKVKKKKNTRRIKQTNLTATFKLDCEQSLFCSKNPAGGAARKRVRRSLSHPRYSRLEYRARGFAVRPARIFEQKRDCSQSTFKPYELSFHSVSVFFTIFAVQKTSDVVCFGLFS